jgi:hypothetical protein
MTTIAENTGLVTLINVFTVEPSNQQKLLDILARATDTSVRARVHLGGAPSKRRWNEGHDIFAVEERGALPALPIDAFKSSRFAIRGTGARHSQVRPGDV